MRGARTRQGAHSALPLPRGAIAAFAIAIAAVLLIAFASYQSLQSRSEHGARVAQTVELLEQLQAVGSSLKDAETSERGFLLTGAENYLEPYTAARSSLATQLDRLRRLATGTPSLQQPLASLEALAAAKLEELEQTIALRRTTELDPSRMIPLADRGKVLMDRFRAALTELQTDQQRVLEQRQDEWQLTIDQSNQIVGGGSALLLALVVLAFLIATRDFRERETEIWLRAGQAGLSLALQGEQRLDAMGDKLLNYLAPYLGAAVAALYVQRGDGQLHRIAGYALLPGAGDASVQPGDGLLGQAAKSRRAMRVRDVPEGYLPIGSALGRGGARELLIAPASVDGTVHGVIELGLLRTARPEDEELLDRITELVAISVRSAKERERVQELLEETQRLAEELQAQQEELRVSNEELEEQARALKESQAQLEVQQTELEQTNANLEEHTQLLEAQKDELARAKAVVAEKAEQLQRSNQYKSEFLANMSHELRTPLNSTLILAKLLSDNKDGNLSAEQVKFAQTISSAGDDLLTLINDILDLSKIEAGKVDVNPEPVHLARMLETLTTGLQPQAAQKGLALHTTIDPGTPQQIETDATRLGQILKNLLSNALKFTRNGEVALHVTQPTPETVAFAVRDTGIGIAEHQHELIFEAFRQADGSTHRKYGGTGLGLSIARDLARLLGGQLALQSAPGQGSVFTLTLPRVYAPRDASEDAGAEAAVSSETSRPADAPRWAPARADLAPARPGRTAAPAAAIEDDRNDLASFARTILVIEDDVRFACILRDLAREMDFRCVVTHTAGDGLAAALEYRPSAILLDVNLPDHSGLGVLDQLKRNPQTRHIPVHVMSVADYMHEARELGAAGYDLKPVKREQIVAAMHRLEAKFSQRVGRVLVVEDDARQRESIGQLLGNGDVEITAVENATEALARLRDTTFDCMVMDLNLPDLSGYELLERMAEQDASSFPPVIVYTGRSLTRHEEQQLRRFSRSIIIKDARSPERLLDEVTLFLHQVESTLPAAVQRMLKLARDRDSTLEGRRILVVEDDVRNIFALTSVLEPKGAKVELARNGLEALEALARSGRAGSGAGPIELVLMDIMMPEMDGLTAMREIRKQPEWKRLPIIALTAKAMKDDQENCLAAGANDYIAKPLDVEKLLSLVRVWMPK